MSVGDVVLQYFNRVYPMIPRYWPTNRPL